MSDRIDKAAVRAEIEELVVEAAYLLDRGRFDEMLALYTEDCEVTRVLPPFTDGKTDTLRGRTALGASYADPATWPPNPRTMRHVLSNLRIVPIADGHVAATVTWTGYRHEGAGLSVSNPMAVGDYEDEHRRSADGHWRIHRRKIVIAFLNQELLAAATARVGTAGNR